MGRNTWIKQLREEDGDFIHDRDVASPTNVRDDYGPRRINIGGKATIMMGKGDRLLIETPGGGAWGCGSDVDGAGKEGKGLVGMAKEAIGWAARGSLAERAAAQAGF